MTIPATETAEAVPSEGMRERKKRLTRELISNTATQMFMARGFDEVKVIEVARASDVSEKTVYNYFPTKESLLLDREDAMAEAIGLVLGPDASLPPIPAALKLLATQLEAITAPLPAGRQGVAALRRFTELLESTASLRAAQRDIDIRLVNVAAKALAARAEVSPDEPEPQIAAQAILGLWRIQFGALRRYTAQGIGVADGLHDKVTNEVIRAARLIDSGLWSFTAALSAPGGRDRMSAATDAAHRSARQVSTTVRRARSAWRQSQPDNKTPDLAQR